MTFVIIFGITFAMLMLGLTHLPEHIWDKIFGTAPAKRQRLELKADLQQKILRELENPIRGIEENKNHE